MRGYLLTADDIIRRNVIMNLMYHFHLDKQEIQRKYEIDFDIYFKDELKDIRVFVEDGLIQLSENGIIVNENGRIVIRNIAMIFDAFLRNKDKTKHHFSRTI